MSGRGQGVWYRAWTERQAGALGLDGWVRNRRDGTVEAVLSGDVAVVEQMISELWDGPDLAQVKAIDRYPHAEAVTPGFAVKPTAKGAPVVVGDVRLHQIGRGPCRERACQHVQKSVVEAA